LEFFHHRLSEQHYSKLCKTIRTKSAAYIEIAVESDGIDKTIRLHVEPMYRPDGSMNYLVITHSDITSAQQTKLALHESNQKLKSLIAAQSQRINEHEMQIGVIFDQAMDPMILLNETNQILDANDATLSMFALERTDLLGLNLTSIFSELDPTLLTDLLNQIPLYQEVQLRDPLTFAQNNSSLLLNGAIRYISLKHHKYILLTLRDRSSEHFAKIEIKRQQNELEEVVRNLNLATQAGGIGIWSWDFESNEVTWDERMYSIYGVHPDECDNNYAMWQERVHPDDIEHAEQSLLHARETLSQFNSEFRILLPSGDIRWVKAAADVIFAADSTTAIAMGGVNIDITKEKNAQDLLRNESEAAQAASEAKSMFLANMSHEIRTPMNGVVGMLSLLSETELNSEQSTMINTIKDSALTLLHIINDILDFSKIEAGQMSLESVPVELQTLLERTMDVLHLQANNKGIEMYLNYDPSLPKMIMSDGVRLSQVILNLLGNAVKFTESHDNITGKISISASLSFDGIAPCIQLRVQDNGIGMSEKQQKNLFKAFSQADSSTTRLYGGTGLGLSITQSLLSMMGGSITVDSHLGSGSCFSVELPFIAVENSIEDSLSEPLSNIRVLMVTNDKDFSTFCDFNLQNINNKRHSVSSLSRAIAVIKHALSANIEIGTIILGPDVYQGAEYQHLSSQDLDLLKQFKLVKYSSDGNQLSGPNSTNSYTVKAGPFKASELSKAIGVLNGLISPHVEVDDTKELVGNEHKEKSGYILVIDDQATNRDVLQRQLSHFGYQCELAVHGQEALRKWKNGNFDLILTDCHMPVMDGYELTKQIRQLERQDNSKGHIPIIAITANAMKESSEQCMSSGMDDFLTKPVELATLGRVVEKWLKLSPLVANNNPNNSDSKRHELEMSEPTPICMKSLENILGTTELSIIGPLLAGYWESVSEDIEMATEALSQRNEHNLQQIAHAAKGAAKSAGAEQIASIFESIQNTAMDKDWQYLSDSLQRSRTESNRLKSYLLEKSIITDTEVSL
ncbi:response regulator, partial [Vibrio aquaticus]